MELAIVGVLTGAIATLTLYVIRINRGLAVIAKWMGTQEEINRKIARALEE